MHFFRHYVHFYARYSTHIACSACDPTMATRAKSWTRDAAMHTRASALDNSNSAAFVAGVDLCFLKAAAMTPTRSSAAECVVGVDFPEAHAFVPQELTVVPCALLLVCTSQTTKVSHASCVHVTQRDQVRTSTSVCVYVCIYVRVLLVCIDW